MQDGWQVVEQALAVGVTNTARTGLYRCRCHPATGMQIPRISRERTLAYEAAMEQLAQDYPEDS